MFKTCQNCLKTLFFAAIVVLAWTTAGRCTFTSVTVTDLKSPATFYTGKFINVGDFEYTVVSTSPADSFGMEPGWTADVNLVSASGLCNSAAAVANDLSTSTLSDPVGRQVYVPQFRILRSFTGSSVRFQVTISSANSTVLGRACSSAIDVFDYESSSMTLLKTVFFTGKNANATGQTGARVTLISSSSANGFGLEPWMAVHVAVVPVAGTASNSNEVSPATINMSTGSQNQSSTALAIRPQAPHTGSSVRFQLTISSANGTTALVPRLGSNPSFTSAINIYDYVLSSLTILSAPPIYVVNSTVNPSGLELVVRSTETAFAFGLEDYMRVSIDLLAANNALITGGLSGISPTLSAGAVLNYPEFYPRFSSGGSQTLKYRVTITSATGTTLIPQFGINPATSTFVGVAPGSPSKLVLLPLTEALLRPGTIGRAFPYDITNPKVWTPTALGESLTVRVTLTDSWSNPVDITPDTRFVNFTSAQYLTLPPLNSGDPTNWLMDPGFNGTVFDFDIAPFEVPVPIAVTSIDGFASDTIYVTKSGLPVNTVFVGPSPFNPKIGQTTTFAFRVGADMTVKTIVLDLFGRKVWETSVQATANLMNTSAVWNGRNGNGDLVASGVYWAVLEIDGDWKSKKKFAVVK